MRRYREKVYEHCSHISDMEIKIGRATAIFGEYDNFDEETCHVIPALIKRSLRGDDPFVVWGTSDVVRDFLYVKDVVKGCLLILENGLDMRPYNLGSGESVTIGDVVNAIMNLSIKNKKPIGNGIITCLNMQQAIERADPNKKNKGGEAVSAVLQTLVNF